MKFLQKLLTPVAKTVSQKAANVIAAFSIHLIWVAAVTAFYGYLQSQFYFGPPPFKIVFFMAVIAAPLWEELAFRVIPIQLGLKLGKETLPYIIILSSILFGLGHGNGVYSLMVQGVMGVIASVLYIRNNYSYWSVVALHAIWNLFCLSLDYNIW